jgi:hypothetical protein
MNADGLQLLSGSDGAGFMADDNGWEDAGQVFRGSAHRPCVQGYRDF